jgi:hypothetical protein
VNEVGSAVVFCEMGGADGQKSELGRMPLMTGLGFLRCHRFLKSFV